MQTLLTILTQTTDYLQRKGVEEPRLDAQWLLAHGLGIGRLDLYLQFDRPLIDEEVVRLRALVVRRGRREPLQHILGTTAFGDLEILCDRRALIPRPETEQLVELALQCAITPTGSAAEIGTGTGAPILLFAQKRPEWSCRATDLSGDALALARDNARHNGLAERVEFLQGDLAAPLIGGAPLDLVIANLPYIRSDVMAGLQVEVRDYDPPLALDGGADGLDLVRRLLRELPPLMRPGGYLLLEVGYDQREMIEELVAGLSVWNLERIATDLDGVARFPILRRSSEVDE